VRIPSLAKSLRAEIRRLAAREVEKALKSLRRVQKQLRSLKTSSTKGRRSLARVEKRLANLKAGRPAAGMPGRPGRRVAVGGDDIRALRARLGMTRLQFAKLIDVSPGSVFGWEKGKTTPRGATVARLGEAKKLGVRAARARVEAVSPGTITRRKPRARKASAPRRRRRSTRSPANRSRRAA
jgi:transcriptional regulator with XRE-family HTH domain